MNKKRIKFEKVIPFFMMLFLVMGFASLGYSQFSNLGGELKWLRIGEVHTHLSEYGTEFEYAGPAGGQGMFWPAAYGGTLNGSFSARGIFLGCKDYFDARAGITYDYKTVLVGPRTYPEQTEQFMTYDFRLVGSYEHPSVVVDDQLASINNLYDIVDDINADIKSERMIITKQHTAIGATITKKVMAFGHPDHDDYLIYDFVIKNTGIINENGEVNEQTLKDFYFTRWFRYALAGEAIKSIADKSENWVDQPVSWGANTVNGLDKDERALYAYYGPFSARQLGQDDWGCPNIEDGRHMAAARYGGCAVLHADISATNKSNDSNQPHSYRWRGSDGGFIESDAYNQFSPEQMFSRYEFMQSETDEVFHEEWLGDEYADVKTDNAGGYSSAMNFGPYTLASGDSIHIVFAEAVKGLSMEKNREVTQNWFQYYKGTGTPALIMPDGSESNNATNYKKAWVQTSRDSLFDCFERARLNFENNYQISQPPPPPESFMVQSGGDRIKLSWADNATTWENFDGYVIYRSEGNVLNPRSVYKKLFECDAADAVHSFDDTTAQRGFDYYYYIQSKDDGSTNELSPGTPLVSSLFWTVTNKEAQLQRPAAERLAEVRVVPNPYDIRARVYQFGDKFQYDRIAFYGLPPVCDVKVLTERGDIIWEKEHTNFTGDELWDSMTSSGQIVVSGVYILYVEVTEDTYDEDTGELTFSKGESVFRKFVIIR